MVHHMNTYDSRKMELFLISLISITLVSLTICIALALTGH